MTIDGPRCQVVLQRFTQLCEDDHRALAALKV